MSRKPFTLRSFVRSGALVLLMVTGVILGVLPRGKPLSSDLECQQRVVECFQQLDGRAAQQRRGHGELEHQWRHDFRPDTLAGTRPHRLLGPATNDNNLTVTLSGGTLNFTRRLRTAAISTPPTSPRIAVQERDRENYLQQSPRRLRRHRQHARRRHRHLGQPVRNSGLCQ